MSPSRTRPSPARGLTRERLIEVAAEIVEQDGLDALSMRGLAERLGVSAMTPYSHIAGKDELLRALADRYLGEIVLPDPSQLGWEDVLRAVFRSVREVLLAHPALATITARHHINGPSGYRGAEAVLGVLRDAGLSAEQAVGAFAALSAFTTGFVQQELPLAARVAQLGERVMAISQLPADGFPHIHAASDAFIHRDSARHFDMGLDLLIDGIAAAGR